MEVATRASREIEHSFKLSAGWEHAFFGDYKTSVSAYFNARSGLPYTWLINGDPNGDGIFQDPAYIPLLHDPHVTHAAAHHEHTTAFHEFLHGDDSVYPQPG